MRRTLILLAALLVGIGGQWTARAAAGSAPADAPAAAQPGQASAAGEAWGAEQITAAAGTSPTAFVRSGSSAGPVVWYEGAGSGPRPLHRRTETAGDRRIAAAGVRQATLRSRVAAHRAFGSPLALQRAGRSSSSTTTPPPFRSV